MLDALRLDATGAFLVLLELGLVMLGREGLDLGCIFGDAVVVSLLGGDYSALGLVDHSADRFTLHPQWERVIGVWGLHCGACNFV